MSPQASGVEFSRVIRFLERRYPGFAETAYGEFIAHVEPDINGLSYEHAERLHELALEWPFSTARRPPHVLDRSGLSLGSALLLAVALSLAVVWPAVDAPELDDVAVAEVGKRLGGQLAAVATAAVHEYELAFIGEGVFRSGRHAARSSSAARADDMRADGILM